MTLTLEDQAGVGSQALDKLKKLGAYLEPQKSAHIRPTKPKEGTIEANISTQVQMAQSLTY